MGTELRLYVFDIHTYCPYYMVLAASPQEALDAVKAFLRADEDEDSAYDWKLWEHATLENLPVVDVGSSDPYPYHLDVYEQGQVLVRCYD